MSVNKTIEKLPEIRESISNVVLADFTNASEQKVSEILSNPHHNWLWQKLVHTVRTFRWYKNPEAQELDRGFFGKDIYPEEPSEFFQEKMNFISENGRQLTSMLANHLWCKLPDVPLFDSPGTLVQLDKQGALKDSYHNFENILSEEGGNSTVSEKYNHNVLWRMAFEKAYFHFLISLIPVWSPLSTAMIQEYLTKLAGEDQYRGGFHNPTTGETFGNSASSLNEEVVESILKHFYPEMSIEDHCKRYDFHQCNLLAGIGDELMSRILALGEERLVLIMDYIASHIRRAAKGDTMWMLH